MKTYTLTEDQAKTLREFLEENWTEFEEFAAYDTFDDLIVALGGEAK